METMHLPAVFGTNPDGIVDARLARTTIPLTPDGHSARQPRLPVCRTVALSKHPPRDTRPTQSRLETPREDTREQRTLPDAPDRLCKPQGSVARRPPKLAAKSMAVGLVTAHSARLQGGFALRHALQQTGIGLHAAVGSLKHQRLEDLQMGLPDPERPGAIWMALRFADSTAGDPPTKDEIRTSSLNRRGLDARPAPARGGRAMAFQATSDLDNRKRMFSSTHRIACHPIGGAGGYSGPGLGSVRCRYSLRDILVSICPPSVIFSTEYMAGRVKLNWGGNMRHNVFK